MTNLIHSTTIHEVALQHNHDMVDAAEVRRQAKRFSRWMSAGQQTRHIATR